MSGFAYRIPFLIPLSGGPPPVSGIGFPYSFPFWFPGPVEPAAGTYTPTTGPITGGTAFILTGTNFTAYNDTLQEYGSAPIPPGIYTQNTSGTGTISANAYGVVSSITNPGDSAGLTYRSTNNNIDAQVSYSSTYSSYTAVNLNYDITVAALRLQVDSGTYFEVAHHIKSGSYIQVTVYSAGQQIDQYKYATATSIQQLRLVRIGPQVTVFVGGVQLLNYTAWTDQGINVSFYSAAATGPSSITPFTTTFSNFELNAVVAFGAQPAQNVSVVAATRIRGSTPPVAYAQSVSVAYYGYDGSQATFSVPFEYVNTNSLILTQTGGFQLAIGGDAAVVSPIVGQPGLGLN